MNDPLHIDRNGRRTWLKWHRARRRAGDPAFTGARILEGMRLGASVEVDLVVHGGQGFAVLHNFTLEEETTGTGEVRNTPPEALRALHLRDNAGNVLPDRVMLLEDLCALLTREPPHPHALLQLDLKEEAAALDPGTVRNFARTVGPVAGHMILSGGDIEAVTALARAVPGLRTGFDPCYGDHLARLLATGDYHAFIAEALAAAPEAALIYLDHEIVLAADAAGIDLIAPVQAAGRRVDAWTIREASPQGLAQVARLLALGADQITTDDPEGIARAFA